MDTINRIRALCKSKGIKISYLEKQIGAYQGFFANVASGKNFISKAQIEKVASILGTSLDYLNGQTEDTSPGIYVQVDRIKMLMEMCYGSDEFFDPNDNNFSRERLGELARSLNTTPEYLAGETNNPGSHEVEYKKVPVLSEVAAGIPIQAIDTFDPDDQDSWEEIEKAATRGGEYFGLKIHGNSMYPRIMDGDIVIVRKQETVDDGQVAIVTINGENGTCKKIKFRPDGVMLISTNPEVEPLFFTHKQVLDLPVRIIGRVVKVHGDI